MSTTYVCRRHLAAAVRRVGRCVAEMHRAQTVMWQVRLGLPIDDGTMRWVRTPIGPRLRGSLLPDFDTAGHSEAPPR